MCSSRTGFYFFTHDVFLIFIWYSWSALLQLQRKKVNKKRRRFRKKAKNPPVFIKIAKLAALRQRNFLNEKQSDFLNAFFLRRISLWVFG